MGDTWLPVQLGGNARWQFNSTRDEIAVQDTLVQGVTPVPTCFFPTVPDDQMWAFERIVLNNYIGPGPFEIRLFLDDDRTDTTQAYNDQERIVDGLWEGTPNEVICRPYPLLVQAGNRVGAVWVNSSNSQIVEGSARAQITTYVRA